MIAAFPSLAVMAGVLRYVLNYFLFDEEKNLCRTLWFIGIILVNGFILCYNEIRDLNKETRMFFYVLNEYVNMRDVRTWILRGNYTVIPLVWWIHTTPGIRDFIARFDKIISTILLAVVILFGTYLGVNIYTMAQEEQTIQQRTIYRITPELSDYLNEEYMLKVPECADLIAGEYVVDESENLEYVRITFKVDFTQVVRRIVLELGDINGRYIGNPVEARREWLYRDEVCSYLLYGMGWDKNQIDEESNSLANAAYANDPEYTKCFVGDKGSLSYVVIDNTLYCCFIGWNPDEIHK